MPIVTPQRRLTLILAFTLFFTPWAPGATAPGLVRIADIQGTAHTSPLAGVHVDRVPGIVIATRLNGFWFQDALPDANLATSEGLFVFTSSPPTSAVGDSVLVSGRVGEFRPGGASSANLTITQFNSPTVVSVSSGNLLPPATVIGAAGRVPPEEIIEDDADGSVETSGAFDPQSDGIDFYESLEGMLVQIREAIAVGASSEPGEIAVVGDGGAEARLRTGRGGIVVRPGDFNPERVILDDVLVPTPAVNVGDRLGSVTGVLDYSFGNFKLLPTSSPTPSSGGLTREVTAPAAPGELTIASFNVENLDPGDGAAKFEELARLIANHLQSPDLLSLEEVQDNNGATDDDVVDATETYQALIAAVEGAGGPEYQFRQIDPVDDQDGGEPGGNIRIGFLFRTDRALSFVDRPGGTPTNGTSVTEGAEGAELTFSPGRIDPDNPAWSESRKPLAGEFVYRGRRLFVIANHFSSKGGDQPLFGRFQPPQLTSEMQRTQQAQVVHDFVEDILDADPDANVVVLGDLNDFQFSAPLQTLAGGVLVNLTNTLPRSERYSFVFDGNSQALDHILVTRSLLHDAAVSYDVVHVNAEFAEHASDHDPPIARFDFGRALDSLPDFEEAAVGIETP